MSEGGPALFSAGKAFIEVIPHTAGFAKSLDTQMARVGRRMQSVGKNLTKHVTLPIVGVFAVAAHEGIKAQQSISRMDAAYKAAGINIEKYKDKIEATEKANRKLGFSDDDTRESLGSLIVATKNHVLAIKLQHTAMDIARFRHIKLSQATKMLTMTMTGSQRAAKMLGVTVQPVTKSYDQMKAAFGKVISPAEKLQLAQAKLQDKQLTGIAVMKEVNKRLHGQAKAFAETDEGKMQQFTANLNHMLETLGQHLIPAMDKFIEKLDSLLEWFDHLSGGWKKVIVIGAAFLALIGPLVGIIGTLVVAISATVDAFGALFAGELLAAGPIIIIIAAVAALAIGLVILYKKSDTFRRIVNAAFHAVAKVVKEVVEFIKKHWRLMLIVMTGAVGAAIVLIIGHWQKFKSIIIGIFNFVKHHWLLLLTVLTGGLAPVVVWIIKHFQTIKHAIFAVIDGMKTAFEKFWNWLETRALQTALSVVEPFSHLPGGLGGWARKAKDAINAELDKIHPAKINTVVSGGRFTTTIKDRHGHTDVIVGSTMADHMHRKGGRITGGQTGRDSVPAWLSPGEVVLTGHGQRMFEQMAGQGAMAHVIKNQAPHFQAGGVVGGWNAYAGKVTKALGPMEGRVVDTMAKSNELLTSFLADIFGTGNIESMIAKANEIDARHFPYRWGGGHNSNFAGPYDCSGAVSAVLHAAGLLRSPLVSGQLAQWGQEGMGQEVDILANPVHTYMLLRGRAFGTSGQNPGGGAGWFAGGIRPGFAIRHPIGFRRGGMVNGRFPFRSGGGIGDKLVKTGWDTLASLIVHGEDYGHHASSGVRWNRDRHRYYTGDFGYPTKRLQRQFIRHALEYTGHKEAAIHQAIAWWEKEGYFDQLKTRKQLHLPLRAMGGPVSALSSYIVGENGPEVFRPKVPGTIIPNHKLVDGRVPFSVGGWVDDAILNLVHHKREDWGHPSPSGTGWSRRMHRFLLKMADGDVGIPTQRLQRRWFNHWAGRGVSNAELISIIPWWESKGYFDQRKTRSQLHLPLRAGGGRTGSGSQYLVGERGPELFVPDHSALIHRAHDKGSDDPSRHRIVIENWDEGTGYMENLASNAVDKSQRSGAALSRMRRS